MDKATAVKKVIKDTIDANLLSDVVVACSLSEAVKLLGALAFDLVILDLMIPYLPKGREESGAGLELLRELRRPSNPSRSALVVGLSAYPDEVETARPEFDQMAVAILKFDDEGHWKGSIAQISRQAEWLAQRNFKLDFLIFVALDEELQGYKEADVVFEAHVPVEGINVQFLRLKSDLTKRGAIIKLRRMGLVSAAVDGALAIPLFRPSIVCMSGICAGFAEAVELGQIVVSSPSWEYQAGKWSEDGFLIEPFQIALRPATRVKCDQMFSDKQFVAEMESGLSFNGDRPSKRAQPKVAPSVSGSAVVADEARIAHIAPQHRKLSALDMETFGIYSAAVEADWFVDYYFSLKVVVDFADAAKSDDIHDYGCAIAAKTSLNVITALFV
jgi:nucleoside phosphorylase/CheY-like chemotaxis protein